MAGQQVGIIYLMVMNLAGLAVMGIDKRRAKKREWRISERTLFLISIAGGSIGTWMGMYVFRHKTRHLRFVVGMPAIAAVHVMAALLLCLWLRR